MYLPEHLRRHAAASLALTVVFASALILLTGCGGDKKAADNTTTTAPGPCTMDATGKGCVIKAVADTVTVDFSTTQIPVGSQVIVMPYILGDLATVSGSLGAHTFTFDVGQPAAAAGFAATIPPSVPKAAHEPLAPVDPFTAALLRDHDKRTLANRFDPAKGADQGADFWEIAQRLDATAPRQAQLVAGEGIESHYRKALKRRLARGLRLPVRAQAADANGCPTTSVIMPGDLGDTNPKNQTETDTVTAADVVSTATYCIVYVSKPVTEPSKAAIETSIKTILSTYQAIYKDSFPAIGTYKFQPIYTVVDVSDSNSWNQAPALQLAGAFFRETATAANQPTIYIAADFHKVKTFEAATDTALLTRQFHSVLAHETQHAILDYYRRAPNAAIEPISVDEGLAHFMEDLFGYAQDAFAFWAQSYLAVEADGVIPFLVGPLNYAGGKDPVDPQAARAGAHTLLYYLSSQKGGVEFTNGVASGGGGLDYVVSVVKNTSSSGPTNLSTQFGGDWTTTIGNYLAALNIDGVTLADKSQPQYTVADPQAVVNDLTGGTGKTYGMHFNLYGGVAAHTYDDVTKTPSIAAQSYYMMQPLTYTVATLAQTLTFKCNCAGDTNNIAVSVIRIK